jgi:hypothetical protein
MELYLLDMDCLKMANLNSKLLLIIFPEDHQKSTL